jgi:hypothetical protein
MDGAARTPHYQSSPRRQQPDRQRWHLYASRGRKLRLLTKKVCGRSWVKDLVIVETPDALLITTRERSQDVGKIVKYLDEKKLHKLV